MGAMDRRPDTLLAAAPPAPPGAARRGGSRLPRWLGRGLGAAALTYGGLVGLLFATQEWLIFPGRATQGSAASACPVPPGCELLRLRTASGEQVAALFGPA